MSRRLRSNTIAETSLTPPYSDLEAVLLSPNRKKEWPIIWLCRHHPQWKNGPGPHQYRREAYVYICDTTPEGMLESLRLGAQMEAPTHGEQGIADFGRSYCPSWVFRYSFSSTSKGSFGLESGQALFARASTGTGNAKNDVIQAWVNGWLVVTRDLIHVHSS